MTLISKVTKSLINKGYISKKSDSEDKRISNQLKWKLLNIPKFLEIYSEFNETALKNFTEEEHKMFGNLLMKYFSNIQSFKKTNWRKIIVIFFPDNILEKWLFTLFMGVFIVKLKKSNKLYLKM